MFRDADRVRLDDMVEHGRELMAYMEGVTLDAYVADRRLILQVERLLEIIGEAARATSDQARAQVDLDWRGVIGLRNIIAHQYGRVDLPRLFAVAVNRVPVLVDAIENALPP